jgi:tetratricopeptide (TPR) repeat protein
LKKHIFAICFLFIAIGYSFASWDSLIPDGQKADFLMNYISQEYKEAKSKKDIKRLKYLRSYLPRVSDLDNSRKDEVKRFQETAKKEILGIMENNIKDAEYYIKKKFIISAAIQYKRIKEYDPFNKKASDFFKQHKKEINDFAEAKKKSAAILIKKKDYIAAEKELRLVKKLFPNSPAIDMGLSVCQYGRSNMSVKYYHKASESLKKKNYDEAIKNSRISLAYDPSSERARKILNTALQRSTKYTVSTGKNGDDNAEQYFQNAGKYFDSGDYEKALSEINIFLRSSKDKKGGELKAKIASAFVEELMNEAVFNYNSQEYDEALKLFNRILDIEPNNEAAIDYKSRIEKRMKAFD